MADTFDGKNFQKKEWKKKSNTDTMIVSRVPPQNIDAEKSVLGAMMLDKDAILTAEDLLTPADFYREANAIIFQAILNLSHRGEPADILTVTEELKRMGRLDDVGGVLYVNELPANVVTTKSVDRHAEIVAGKAKLRRLIDAAGTIADEAYSERQDVADITDDAEKSILEVTRDERRSDFTPIGEAVQSELQEITRKFRNKESITGLASGFPSLDALTSGFQKGDFIIVAARPSMGKTAFVLNIAKNMSISSAHRSVAFFSLEMSREQLATRLLSSEACVENTRLVTGSLRETDWEKIAAAAGILNRVDIRIDDNPMLSVADMNAKCRRIDNLGLVVIDYLQLMASSGTKGYSGESRQQVVSDISRMLKIMAKELQVPVLCLSQLSRANEKREDKRPMLSDLRESGAIEQDADIVMFLYRDDYYNEDSEKRNIAECIIAKNRHGETGKVELAWSPQYTTFSSLDYRHEED